MLRAAIAAVVLSIGVGVLLWTETDRLAAFEVLQQEQEAVLTAGYDLTELEAPRLAGVPLQMFAFLMRQPVFNRLLAKKVYRDNDMLEVRKLASYLPDYPLYSPFIAPTIENTKAGEVKALDLSEFSRQQAAATSNGFKHWSIHDYTSRYLSGEVTPTQVARAVLAAINASEQGEIPLRIFVDYHADDILKQARESTARYAKKAPLGVLDGVPVAVKDEMDIQGYATSLGTSFLGNLRGVADHDSLPVTRLRAVGAILLGKTNMHEIGSGVSGYNMHWGTTRNPYNPRHYPGGSSSGSSAAVASGIVPLALGVDGGGSVRIPAAMCGVVGLKPTYLRVPLPSADCASVTQIGPLAGNVRDAAIGYAVISGGDAAFPLSKQQPPIQLQDFEETTSLQGLKVGFFEDNLNHSNPEIATAVKQVLQQLHKLGAELVPVSISHLSAIHTAHSMTISSEMAQYMDQFHSLAHEIAPDVQTVLELARTFTAMDFLAAQRLRAYLIRQLQTKVFNQVDVFVGPATAITAPEIPADAIPVGELNGRNIGRIFRFTLIGNFAGIPGISVPVTYDKNGLPIAVQVQSSHWEEDVMLRVAHAAERAYAKQQTQPQVYFSILDEAKKQKSN